MLSIVSDEAYEVEPFTNGHGNAVLLDAIVRVGCLT
jgi:hypothetical protein